GAWTRISVIMRRRPMPDRLAAYVRTYWPMVLGHVATALAAWLGGRPGVSVDSVAAYELIALTASAGVYALGRWLETRAGDGVWPRVARAAGRWLLALGLHTGQPTYRPAHTKR